MKRWTRKLLAGLLSFGMLLQVASPLSALAAESSGSDAPELTISLLRENEDTPYVGKIDQNTDSITLDGQSYQVDYQDGTYTLTGTMGTFYGSHIGDHLTISGPSDGVKPNLVVRKGENHEVANAYVKVENVNDFTSDSIAGITEFTCDGDINITADYYAVDFSFKVNSAHDVTVISEKATGQFVVGSAYINCTGKVTLRNEGQGALTHGSGITIRGAQDGVELYCKNATRMANGISIKNCKGDISIINENGPIGDPSVSNNLTVGGSGDTGVENVTIKANAPGPVTNGKISVTAKTLNMQNDGGSIGNLTFTRTDTTSAYRVAVGESGSINTQTALTGPTYSETVNAKYLNIQPGTPENTTVKHTLTLTNAKAYTDENHTVEADKNEAGIYSVAKGTKVYVVAEAPDNVSRWKFTGWEESSETSENITVTVNENTTLTAKWEKVTDQVTNYGITVKIGSGDPIKVTSENCGNILGDDYTDDYTDGKLTYNPDTHTLTGEGSFGGMKVEITDDLEDKVDVVLSNANGAVVNGSLTVTGAQDVKVTGVSSTALIMEDATITCAGDILMDNTGVGNVLGYTRGYHGNLDVKSAQNVTIHGVGRTGTDEDENNYTIYGKAEIDCSGDVEITSQNGGAVWDPVVITNAADVTITAAQRAVWDSRPSLDSSIHCSGKVKITSETAAALYEGDLKITGATDVTISGKRDDGATIGGAAEITCSGDVVLENKGTGAVVESKLVYKQNPAKGYEVKTGENAESATVAYTDEEGTTSYTVPNTETDTETNPVPSYISIAAVSTPTDVPGDDDFTGGDSGAGGAVAAVVVGGAAAFVGYEIATDIILRDLLPAGADIPVNRGQLAWLIWGAKGAPEPENQPAFTDVSEPEMAKAAQWCVEQGILTAPGETTFRPNGWVTRVKVIQTWNTAFPKQ